MNVKIGVLDLNISKFATHFSILVNIQVRTVKDNTMAVATVFLFLCFGATIVSATIYGEEISIFGDSWNDYYFLKFNSPSGKTFYIETNDGTIRN